MNATNVIPHAALYALLHIASSHIVLPLVLPESTWSSLGCRGRVEIASKLVSTVHAIRVGSRAMRVILRRRAFHNGGVLTAYPEELDDMYADHVAYTLYDMVIWWRRGGGEQWSMWAHHVLGILGSVAITRIRKVSFFPTAFAATECTVPFANLVLVLERLGLAHTHPAMYRTALVLRALAFVVFRMFIGPMTALFALKHFEPRAHQQHDTAMHRRFGSRMRRFLHACAAMRLPLWVWLLSANNVMVLSGLNMVWSRKVVAAVGRQWQVRAASMADAQSYG